MPIKCDIYFVITLYCGNMGYLAPVKETVTSATVPVYLQIALHPGAAV